MNIYLRASAAILVALATPAMGFVANANPAVAYAAPLVLKLGSPVAMKTTTELTSKKSKIGDHFLLTVTQDVVVDGQVVIPAGSTATGEITRVRKKGSFGRSGQLEARVLYVEVGNNRIELTGQFDAAGKGNTTGTVAVAVMAGVFSAFVTGKSAIIAPGTEVSGYAAKDTEVAAVSPAA